MRSAWRMCGLSSMRPSSDSAPESGRGPERGQHAPGPFDLFGGRTERRVDRRDLRRVDRHLAGEALAARLAGAALDRSGIAELGVHRIDRDDARRGCREQAHRARVGISEFELAVGLAVCQRAHVGREILGAPREPAHASRELREARSVQYRARAFSDQRDQPDAARLQARARLERLEPVTRPLDVRSVARLRQHDAVRPAVDHGRQVRQRIAGLDRIDAHPERHVALGTREVARDLLPCRGPAFRNDGILEIEDDRIRAARDRLRKALGAVTRHEQHRAHHAAALRFISAVRLHTATSSLRWLKQRCTNTTMPAPGRERLSRISCTIVSVRSVSPG